MENTNWQELAAKYLTGQCSAEEVKMLEDWQKIHPDEQAYIRSLPGEEQTMLEERMFTNIHQGICQLELGENPAYATPEPIVSRLRPRWPSFLVRVAAMLVVGLGLGYLVYTFQSETPFQQIVNNTAHPIRHVLEDSSVVWLNSKTTLSYPRTFAADQREVRLDGEAFFEVTKNPNRPFIIRSGHIETRVLGTSFNVKAYQGDEAVEVNVITGRVAVQKLSSAQEDADWDAQKGQPIGEVILKPNEKAVYYTKSEHLTKALTEKPIEKIAWKEDKVLFDNVSVREVVKTLERKYNIVIQTPNEAVNNCIIKIDATGHSLENTLKMVCQLVNAAYTLDKHEVIIQGQGCPVSPEIQSTF